MINFKEKDCKFKIKATGEIVEGVKIIFEDGDYEYSDGGQFLIKDEVEEMADSNLIH